MDDDVVYRSVVKVVRERGPRRRAELPARDEPIYFGVHDEVAAYYGTDMSQHEPATTTLDYVVAAATGWLAGTFGGALEARKVPAGEGRLVAEGVGEIETDGKALVIRRIHVRYTLQLADEHRETAERAHSLHADFCPVARTIRDCVAITTSLEMEGLGT